jgi:2-desacetyl-2-hydroxyethyl bacteriochlorophyllide A dehydrogenase
MNSKYIVFPKPQTVAVWDEQIEPPGEGEILCKAEKSLISIGTELNCLRGVFDPGTNWADWVKYPFRPGYSMVGRVIAVGKGVEGIKEGDRVSSYDVHQQYYRTNLYAAQSRQAPPEGTGPYLLPEAISNEEGTWRAIAVTCQNGVRRAQLELGEFVAVVGLGLLGQVVTRYLTAAGARAIIAIDPVQSRLDLAKQGGATHTLNMSVNDAVEPIRDITKGWMADVAFDVTGHPATLALTIQLMRRLGRLVLLGDTPTPTAQHLGPGVVSNSVSILGIHGYMIPDKATPFSPWTAQRMSDVFFNFLMSGKMKVAELVTHRYSPLQAPEVYQNLVKDRSTDVGVIFDWTTLD